MQSDRNRELLAEQLEEKYVVQTHADTPFETPQFDLCLLDTPSLKPPSLICVFLTPPH